ncbi:carbohydrate kinase family protein [soil metagenome]
MTIVLSGSLAFDYIMNFPGYFEDHILPDRIHVLNVSFLVDSLDRQRGGVAGNIAYSLGLLGQPCRLVGTVGNDFEEYRAELEELGIDLSGVVTLDDLVTASAFITTDRADNQITGFFPGAMSCAGEYGIDSHLDRVKIGVVSPTAPAAMRRHVDELKEAGLPFMFDPGQQVVALSAEDVRAGVEGAYILAANDYELAMIEEKLETTRDAIVAQVPVVAITFGDLGSTLYAEGETYDIPPSEPWRVVDPTGAGDGYRAGLVAGYTRGINWEATGRIASTAAAFVVEQKGTQAHQYTRDEFRERFEAEFPDHADALETLFDDIEN